MAKVDVVKFQWIRSFRETFESSLDVWERSEYEEQWRQAIRRIVDGSECSALITDLYEPESANFIRWWPVYRMGDEVRFHNQLLLMASLSGPFELTDLYRHVPPYQQTNEDGERISEWTVPIRSLASYL